MHGAPASSNRFETPSRSGGIKNRERDKSAFFLAFQPSRLHKARYFITNSVFNLRATGLLRSVA
jgi:hypothetical protein